jgi:peptide-methionine (S)-S-oxide reductase
MSIVDVRSRPFRFSRCPPSQAPEGNRRAAASEYLVKAASARAPCIRGNRSLVTACIRSSARLAMIRRTALKILPLASAVLLAGLAACGSASASSDFVKLPAPTVDAKATSQNDQVAVLAGGCFWGVEAVFEHVKGVRKVTAGYSGGDADSAKYGVVSDGHTGHAETVKVQYDPSQVSYGQLLQVFFSVALNPTELNRQGPDSGTQYRSVVFYGNAEQKKVADDYIAQLTLAKSFPAPIVTQVVPLKAFYAAEAYHQNYFNLHPNNPYIVINDAPKVRHLKQLFPTIYQTPDQRQVVEVQLH